MILIDELENQHPNTICVLPKSGTSEPVLRFAQTMEGKLDKNRHKGDREGWLAKDPWELLTLLKKEVVELEQALEYNHTANNVGLEAADVANFAMMVADSYRHRHPGSG